MQVLCDTSFLIIITNKPAIRTKDIESEYGKFQLLVPDLVLAELGRLVKSANPKRSKMASNTLGICSRLLKIEIPFIGKNVDDSLIEYAKKYKVSVATIDKYMIKKLIENNVLVFTLSNDKVIVGNYRKERNRQL
ncbi:MAG: hypothetical protein DA328_02235 [Nitrososphaeraceae archaeon]|nr:hypothetical protein [Nitrososphaeraceae archaeon]